MEVVLNGEKRELADGATVTDVLRLLELEGRRVAVELNREIVPRDTFGTCVLRHGDAIEVVHFVGGG